MSGRAARAAAMSGPEADAVAVTAQQDEPVVRVLAGYPDPEEVAALVAVLTAVARAGTATSGPEPAGGRARRAPAGVFADRYQSPTSWQAP